MTSSSSPLVLVTGASNGIGRAIAARLIQDGHRVINLDQKAPAQLMAGETFHAVDVTKVDELRALLDDIARREPVLRLVNNVGTVRPASVENQTLEDIDTVVAVNLKSTLLCTQAMLPAMKVAKFGRIVNIASRAALGKELRTAYAATKAGLLGMTRTWALELGRHGVTVNAIGPGPIDTELFRKVNPPDDPRTQAIIDAVPVRRLGTPDDIAHAAAYLLDERSGFMTGQVLYVCGGMTVGLSG